MTRLAPIAILLLSLPAAHQAPETGWCTEGRVTRVVDGDTVVVELRRTVRVRLLDCWCPESRTRDPDEKRRGLAAKAFTRRLLDGQSVRLWIPTHGHDISKVMTLGRVLGHVWRSDDLTESVSEQIVAAGHGTRTKE